MNKGMLLGAVIFLLLLIIVAVGVYYQHLCILDLAADMEELSTSLEELDAGVASLYQDVQDMRYDIKEINKTLDHILAKLWLTRPPMPENNRPIPAEERVER
jgi:outer membrane murein-binding lipoprotein Lpp